MFESIQQVASSANAVVAVVSTLGGVLLSLLAIKFATKREVSNVIAKAAASDETIKIELSKADKDLQTRVRALEDGYLKLTERLNEFPTKSALGKVCLELEETQGDLKETRAGMVGLSDLLKRVENTVSLLLENEMKR
jgi:hypothetical protein